jgi:hypothetical protein
VLFPQMVRLPNRRKNPGVLPLKNLASSLNKCVHPEILLAKVFKGTKMLLA